MNFSIIRKFPRHSTRFVRETFGDKPLVVVEIGTYQGYNAKNLKKELNIKELYLIDPYKYYGEEKKDDEDLDEAKDIALLNVGSNHNWIYEHSDKAINKIPTADFIYIDGEHTYQQCKKDMNNYWKKLKPGGVMGGHDVTNPMNNYAIAKAFVEFCSKKKLKPYISRTDWWVVKPSISKKYAQWEKDYIEGKDD